MLMRSNVKILRNVSGKIRELLNKAMNHIRCKIKSERKESPNAAIRRMQAMACVLYDESYLSLIIDDKFTS